MKNLQQYKNDSKEMYTQIARELFLATGDELPALNPVEVESFYDGQFCGGRAKAIEQLQKPPNLVLAFNSGGSGARPEYDGLNATAFPSGVMTMPIEATEHAGPVIIWRKELRPDSGGAGRMRGGLGQ